MQSTCEAKRRTAAHQPSCLHFLAALLFLSACSDSEPDARRDAGTDAAPDAVATLDAEADAASDAPDAQADAELDGQIDVGTDEGVDGGALEAGVDAGLDGALDGGAPDGSVRPPPDFLDPSAYADLIAIDADFPFGVTRRYDADGDILGSRWGRHGGPMVSLGSYGAVGGPVVVRWTPADDGASLVPMPVRFTVASDLPARLFYGIDGMVDLPFGDSALLSYTGSGFPFPGEALLYSADYDVVVSRAFANGFYSGVGVNAPGGPAVVYSGLSPLSPRESSTNENGLYAMQVCEGELVADACPASWRVFDWDGLSGPVTRDKDGNVFVSAFIGGGDATDVLFGVRADQLMAGEPVTPARIAGVNTSGTFSIAALAPTDGEAGWLLGLGYDVAEGIYAANYLEQDGALQAGAFVEPALSAGDDVDAFSVFADDEGDLWLALVTGSSGVYLELRRSEL
ncbi:MAG: hypothetical protein AAF411_10460 [Myxococcota bacterium]